MTAEAETEAYCSVLVTWTVLNSVVYSTVLPLSRSVMVVSSIPLGTGVESGLNAGLETAAAAYCDADTTEAGDVASESDAAEDEASVTILVRAYVDVSVRVISTPECGPQSGILGGQPDVVYTSVVYTTFVVALATGAAECGPWCMCCPAECAGA